MQPEKDANAVAAQEAISHGYARAIDLLRSCITPHGFLASPTERHNYRRIWGRDGAIISLAALLSGEADLVDASRRTFETLARHQGPHGEIPSNLDPDTGRVNFGGTAGRVDSDLWFVIGCAEHWQATGDDAFLEGLLPALERVRFLLGAWELNARGLIYVPLTGDWADEYLHNGYVLYDQLLYLQAQRALARIHAAAHGSADEALERRIGRLRRLIRTNYWFDGDTDPDDVYHEVLYRKGLQAAPRRAGLYWMPSFSPSGYSYRFDALANVLASLLGAADDVQRDRVDAYIADRLCPDTLPLLPSFDPVIKPVDEDWKHLQVMFSYTFKNRPFEYHNGGLWPMLTGFYVADLAGRGRDERARHHLRALHRANAMVMDGEPWGFPEFVHGRRLTPGGTRCQGWSAAAAVIGQRSLEGERVFRIGDRET